MAEIEDQTLSGINSELFKLERDLLNSSDAVSAARDTLLAAKRTYEAARAKAYIETTGTVAEREAKVTLACVDEAEALDVATAAFEYSKAHSLALRDALSALQTRSANIRKEIDLAR